MDPSAADISWPCVGSPPVTILDSEEVEELFSKVLPWSSVSTCFKLSLSSAHVRRYLGHLINREFELETAPDMRCWGVSIVARQTTTSTEYFLQGWRPIAQSLSLKPGDLIHFSLPSATRLRLRATSVENDDDTDSHSTHSERAKPGSPSLPSVEASSLDSSQPKRRRIGPASAMEVPTADVMESPIPALQGGPLGDAPNDASTFARPGSGVCMAMTFERWPSLPHLVSAATPARLPRTPRSGANRAQDVTEASEVLPPAPLPVPPPVAVCSYAERADACLSAFEAQATREVQARLQSRQMLSGRTGAAMIMCARDLSLFMSHLAEQADQRWAV